MNGCIIIFLLCSAILVSEVNASNYASHLDYCTIHHEMGDRGGTAELDSNIHCPSGVIWWSHPLGKVRVHFRYKNPDKKFRVCLSYQTGPRVADLKPVYDITGPVGRVIHISDRFNGDHGEDCGPTVSDEVTLLFEAPSFLTYLMVFEYRLDFL